MPTFLSQPLPAKKANGSSPATGQFSPEHDRVLRPVTIRGEQRQAAPHTVVSTCLARETGRLIIDAHGPIQPKLAIGPSGDSYEREADRIAGQVMGAPESELGATCECAGECSGTCHSEGSDHPREGLSALGPTSLSRLQRSPSGELPGVGLAPDVSGWRDEPASPDNHAPSWELGDIATQGGRPMPPSALAFFEPRFGVSFRHIRLHDSPYAAQLNSEIGARAFTHREHVYFAGHQLDLESAEGRRLMGHELVHTLQQRAPGSFAFSSTIPALGTQLTSLPMTGGPRVQRWEDVQTARRLESFADRGGAQGRMSQLQAGNPNLEYRIVERVGTFVIQSQPAGRAATGGPAVTPPQICGRDSTKVPGFPDPHISRIDIDLGNLTSGLSITWSRPTAVTRAMASTFPISPGAGLCTTCCDNRAASRAAGSLCTPKGNFQVDGFRCRLSTAAWARNATFFAANIRSGIAVHSGPLPSYPASHGCVRTSALGSAIVYDNSRRNTTSVHVGGTWDGPRCYDNSRQPSARERNGSERCGVTRPTRGSPTDTPPPEVPRLDNRIAALGPLGAPIDGAGPA